MLPTTRGTQALIDLEDDAPEVLFEQIPGSRMPFWPFVRMEFSSALSGLDLAYPQMPDTTPHVSALALVASAFGPSRWDVRNLRRQTDLLYIVGGGTTAPTPEGVRNWLVDDFAFTHRDRSAILQWLPLPPPTGLPAFEPTRTLDALVTRAAAYGRLRPVRSDAESAIRRLVPEFARRIDDRFTDEHVGTIVDAALYRERLRPSIERGFVRMLDRVNPRIIVMEDASYGSWASLIVLMRTRGIRVVEPQHGWIGPSHAAYNFGAAMSSPELRTTLPDELLTFGDYWADGLRHPAEITAIGKPHLERQVADVPRGEDRPREVLVVSSTTHPDELSNLVLALRDRLGEGWVIRFRPHPIERPSLATIYPRLVNARDVSIDENSDVAESLAAVRCVVGVASTVLFEALRFGVPVFALEGASSPYYVGDLFGRLLSGPDGLDRVVDAIAAEMAPDRQKWLPAVPVESVWKSNAEDNFRTWAASRLAP